MLEEESMCLERDTLMLAPSTRKCYVGIGSNS